MTADTPAHQPQDPADVLSHLSIFSGIGGIDLAAEWAGFRTIGQVELADYPFRGASEALAGCAKVERC